MPEGCKHCAMCDMALNVTVFDRKSGQRRDCDAAVESLQRLMRARWQDQYKDRYKHLKKDTAKWKRVVMSHRMARKGSKGRELCADVESLVQETLKAKRRVRRRHKKKMTWNQYIAHFLKEEHGGYSKQQCMDNWSVIAQQLPVDQEGVA